MSNWHYEHTVCDGLNTRVGKARAMEYIGTARVAEHNGVARTAGSVDAAENALHIG